MNNGKLTKEQLLSSILTGQELATYKVPHRRKLVGEWLKQGDFGIIFAWRGVGKTWFACSLASALTNNTDLGPWQTYSPVNVLYVDGEMAAEDMKVRTKLLNLRNRHFRLLNHDILFEKYEKDLNLANFEQQDMLTEICIEHQAEVLILDNQSALFHNLAEDKADDWDRIVKPWLLTLRRRKITVILLCHSGKDMKLRGTSKKEDMVFWTLELTSNLDMPMSPNTTQCRFINRFTKSRNTPTTSLDEYAWTLTTAQDYKHTSIEYIGYGIDQRVLSLVQKGYKRCSEIALE